MRVGFRKLFSLESSVKAPSQEKHGVLRVASLQCTGPKQGYSDIFELTPASRVTSSHTVVWRVELACTGASLYGKPPPNCQRPCCAGFGVCYEGCKGGILRLHELQKQNSQLLKVEEL